MRIDIENITIVKDCDEIIADNKCFLIFYTDNVDKLKNYTNILVYKNITLANLSDYKYLVVAQKQ